MNLQGSVVGPGFPGHQVPLVVPNVSGGKPMHYTPTHLPVQQVQYSTVSS